MSATTGRATPLAPDERRDVLVRVFLDLALRNGRVPTTSEIATAAGVAEGTIYRAYPTKEALLTDAVEAAFCPIPVRAEFLEIDLDQPMRDRLVDFVAILQRRFRDVFGLMAALGLTQPPNHGDHSACLDAGRHQRSGDGSCHDAKDVRARPIPGLIDESEITVSKESLLHRLRLLTFSGSHPGIADNVVLTPEEIVDTVLFGVATPDLRACRKPVDPHVALVPNVHKTNPPKGSPC